MRFLLRYCFFLILTHLIIFQAWAQGKGIPGDVIPEGLGVNIHFIDPQPGEMKMMAESGIRWVRMDFSWSAIERERGKYDFSAYDRLLAALKPHDVRLLAILDYSNPLYDNNLAPHTEEGRQAFARWVVAAVKHYKGHGIIWEMWNEPNVNHFWLPQVNAKDYVQLALAVGRALRDAEPGEIYVGPATSRIDFRFLKECFKGGLLSYWDAVTVHPYRDKNPETWKTELQRLQTLITQYAPPDKNIPIFSGEWGYSDIAPGLGEEGQGKYLARQWLFNLSEGIPLSIWYDWRDDGLDRKEWEHHFGMVRHEYHPGREPVFDPKPAYFAAKTLTGQLSGFQFLKRLKIDGKNDYLLLFKKGVELRLVAWTTDKKPHKVFLPASPGVFQIVDFLGHQKDPITSSSDGFLLKLSDGPQYLSPDKPNALLEEAAGFSFRPQSFTSDSESLGPSWRNRER